MKTKTKETALSLFRQYKKNPQQNLSKQELTALTNLSKNKDIVIQKSDKGNSVAIVDKDTYIKRMGNLLSDQRKFEKFTLKSDAFLNFVVNQEKRIEYTVKSSFQSAEEICEQDPTLSMGSLGIDSLFTNIPLDETIDIFVNQFLENTDTVEGFTKSEVKQLLSLATKKSYFIFNGFLYKQIVGVAMGSPLGPSLANTFLSYHETNWLNNCTQGLKTVFYRCYVDDIFILFKSNDHLKYFQDFVNFRYINMSFSMETKKENKLSFLDIEVIREQGKFTYNHNLWKTYF